MMLRRLGFAGTALLALALVAGSVAAPTTVGAQAEPSDAIDPAFGDSTSDFVAAKKTPFGAFAAAKRKWERTRPDVYRVTITQLCFCVPEVVEPRTVTVVGDEVIDVDPPIPGDIGWDLEPLTIDALFDILKRALAEADSVSVRYNRQYGFPESISIDWIELAIDDEVSYRAESFQALG